MSVSIINFKELLIYCESLNKLIIFKQMPFFEYYSEDENGWHDAISTRELYGSLEMKVLDEWFV